VLLETERRLLNPLTEGELQQFEADLRVCGFITQLGHDRFRFQHSAFAEFCVARGILDKHGDFNTVCADWLPFSDETVQFAVTRLRRQRNEEAACAAIDEAWSRELGPIARANAIKLRHAITESEFPFAIDRMTIQGADLSLVRPPAHVVADVQLLGCRFSEGQWSAIDWKNCVFKECTFEPSFHMTGKLILCRFVDCRWDVRPIAVLQFLFCRFTRTTLVVDTSPHEIHIIGGEWIDVTFQGGDELRKRKPDVTVRHVEIRNLQPIGNLACVKIDDCSLCSLSTLALSTLPIRYRPSMERALKACVNHWITNPDRAGEFRSPRSRVFPANEDELKSGRILSRTQRRKLNRLAHQRRRLVQELDGR
jgi:hypothetical protein